MGPVAIIFIGLVPAQLAGASTYLKAKGSRLPRWNREWVAASVAGLVTTLVAIARSGGDRLAMTCLNHITRERVSAYGASESGISASTR